MSAPLAVLLPTYKRPKILRRTVELLQTYLDYPGETKLYVSEDGSEEDYRELARLLSDIRSVRLLRGPARGLGANLNGLIAQAAQDGFQLFLQMDDDHHLIRRMEIDSFAVKLLEDSTCGWIRLMWVGGHKYQARLEERFWRVSWFSPELYIPSNRPHLKHLRFHQWFGKYPEGKNLAQTEEGFCHQCKDKAQNNGGPEILVPLDCLTESSWEHVGESWQAKGY